MVCSVKNQGLDFDFTVLEGDDLRAPFRNCRYLVVMIYVEGNCNIYSLISWHGWCAIS